MPSTETRPPNLRRKLVATAALVALALGILAWRSWPDGRLRAIFPATGGDAVLIQTPAGRYVLIDGGADPAALAAALGRAMPFWRRSLDAIVLTSGDAAHLPGQVAALARYHADIAIAPPALGRGAYADQWRRLLDQQGTPVRIARRGAQLDLDGASLTVLATGDGDAAGMLLRLDYGKTSIVFDQSGGEIDEEELATRAPRPASVVVFPWQRDPRSSLVAALRPRALIFADGQQADRPAELTFAERAVGGAALYHEALDGTITWISDGAREWIETEQ